MVEERVDLMGTTTVENLVDKMVVKKVG